MHERCAAAFTPIIIVIIREQSLTNLFQRFQSFQFREREEEMILSKTTFVRFFFHHLFREIYVVFFSREKIVFVEDSEIAFKQVNFRDKIARTCNARKEMLRRNWWKPISHSHLRDTMYLWSWWIYSWSLEVLFSSKEK